MKTQAQKRAQARRAAMRGWQEGKGLGGARYPKNHPWNTPQESTPPDEFERIVRLKMRGPGHVQAQSHPWRRTPYKGRGE